MHFDKKLTTCYQNFMNFQKFPHISFHQNSLMISRKVREIPTKIHRNLNESDQLQQKIAKSGILSEICEKMLLLS